MCMQHTVFYLLYVNGNAQNGFFVKRYTAREAKNWRYALTQGQNRAVRSTQGGGVTLLYMIPIYWEVWGYRQHDFKIFKIKAP